jgi:hypothetical protein
MKFMEHAIPLLPEEGCPKGGVVLIAAAPLTPQTEREAWGR